MAIGLAVPWDGSEAHKGGHGHHGDDSGKLLFYASDGMRQDAIEQYADDGATPGFKATCSSTARTPPITACSRKRRRTPARAGSR